jgi:hypothetical protein
MDQMSWSAMGWNHEDDLQPNRTGTDRGTYRHGRDDRCHLCRRIAAAAPVIASERTVVALAAARPDTFHRAGALIPFHTGPPTFAAREEFDDALLAHVAEQSAADVFSLPSRLLSQHSKSKVERDQ